VQRRGCPTFCAECGYPLCDSGVPFCWLTKNQIGIMINSIAASGRMNELAYKSESLSLSEGKAEEKIEIGSGDFWLEFPVIP
jgi:hypothetical protein